MTPDELMTLGPDCQYVIAAPKDMPRDALHLHHARYWRRHDARFLGHPNPFVLRKERAARAPGGGKRVKPAACPSGAAARAEKQGLLAPVEPSTQGGTFSAP